MERSILAEYIPAEYNTLSATNVHFKCAQTIRLVMYLILLILTFMMLYILARLSFFFINIWALGLFLIAILITTVSAGR